MVIYVPYRVSTRSGLAGSMGLAFFYVRFCSVVNSFSHTMLGAPLSAKIALWLCLLRLLLALALFRRHVKTGTHSFFSLSTRKWAGVVSGKCSVFVLEDALPRLSLGPGTLTVA